MHLKINLRIYEVSSLSYLLFGFSSVKKWEKRNSLDKKRKIICFMFRNNVFHKKTFGENVASSLLQKEKHRFAKSDVSKLLFPGRKKNYPSEGKIGEKFSLSNIRFQIRLDSNIFVWLLPSKEVCFIWFNERPLKMRNNVFSFIVKSLFVLKISNFLFWLFWSYRKTP